jgi:hypothetical protein
VGADSGWDKPVLERFGADRYTDGNSDRHADINSHPDSDTDTYGHRDADCD